ncbi:RbsD/FucU family protein [Lichenifustis flavocetrariae]|uniref:Ribose ABC transporter n=1 Tax=Lichenifustis flavocetrariae TaxID=2949735 RepID=A0AA41YX55_9HYPH|nr:RbsD/FucU domain-containing protein [Lichenifustis flavocetrariae]MCW6510206.1 ribose ABC transporter [Lichenifustis flavocetrariae]
MLKGIDPLLTPDLLRTLRAMGHGDELAIVDGNFPAESMGPPVVRLGGIEASAALDAILSVMPLDEFVPEAAWRMEVVGQPQAEQPIFQTFRDLLLRHEGEKFRLASLERFAFYARAKACFTLVATGERRLYGNIILKKGVVRSPA